MQSITSNKSSKSRTRKTKSCITCSTCNTCATLSPGQSLFEVIIALAISAIVITALVSLVSNSIQNAAFSRNKTLAANYAQEATEWIRGQRDTDIDLFVLNAVGTRCLNSLSWNGPCAAGAVIPNTPFTRQTTFTTFNPGGKTIIEVDVSVSWTDSKGSHETRSATNFSDWRQR